MKLIMNGRECLRWCMDKKGWKQIDIAQALGYRHASKAGHLFDPNLNLLTKNFRDVIAVMGYDLVCRDETGVDFHFAIIPEREKLDDCIKSYNRAGREILCIDKYDKRAIDITLEPISKTIKSKIKE